MQQTEQFKLNQWQKDDRIRMEDFNSDNLKIENALTSFHAGLLGKASAWEFIGRAQMSGSFTSTGINNVNLDWDQWNYVVLLADIAAPDCDENDSVRLLFDNTDGTGGQTVVRFQAGSFLLFLTPKRNRSEYIKGFGIGHSVEFFSSSFRFENINTFIINLDGSVGHVMKKIDFRFFGIK